MKALKAIHYRIIFLFLYLKLLALKIRAISMAAYIPKYGFFKPVLWRYITLGGKVYIQKQWVVWTAYNAIDGYHLILPFIARHNEQIYPPLSGKPKVKRIRKI